MPFGWERVVTEEDKVVYVDHQTKRTTYTDPRLAFAVEIKEDGESKGIHQPVGKQGFRQRFDASSNAMQVSSFTL